MSHPSSLVIDSLASGKLAGDEARAARAHVDGCARCRGDLAAAEAACAHFTRAVLPRTIGALRPRRRWWIIAPVLVPALAVLALVLWQRSNVETAIIDDVRIKGGMTFQMFANRGGEVMAVRDGMRLRAGDQIRFVVGSGGPAFLLLVSIDGAGTATVYYPYGGERSGPISKLPSELPGSIVLDAAPGPERVFALVSVEPLDAVVVKRALHSISDRIREAERLDLPQTEQASIVFEKEMP